MHPVDGKKCGIFEIDIFAESGRFVYSDWGNCLNFYNIQKEKTYGGTYNSLNPNAVKFLPRSPGYL